ncbi:MAG: 2-oxoglutarate dehydrogenase complex dihydrolipoyllysine-residue succinyltransferase [Bdellovibrionales bacterium]
MTQILVPTLGESVTEATVAQWLKKEGDAVAVDEPILELETDKVTLEVNASEAGVIAKITVGEGENVEVGAILGEIQAGGAAPKKEAPANDAPKAEEKAAPASVASAPSKSEAPLSPAVRKLINDNGLDASQISGTGKDGRITKGDVLAVLEGGSSAGAAEAKAPAVPAQPTPAPATKRDTGPREERVRMTRLRQTVASRLKESQNTAATLTTFNEVDMTAVMELRKQYKDHFEKKHGTKLGFMSFFVKAAVQALKEFPAVNAEIDGTDIIYKNYYNVSIAVSTPQGLVVPVVRDCDEKSMAEIEANIVELGTKAREGKIAMDDMQGGTFTITNGGVFGSLLATPILNTPQVGILGMHKIEQRPIVMPDGSIQARPMMYLALSYDHRIIDGRESVSFLVRIKEALEDPQRLLLDI